MKLVIMLEDGIIQQVLSDKKRTDLKVLVQDWDTEGLEEGALGLSSSGYLLYSFPESVREHEVESLFKEAELLYKEEGT